MAAKQKLELNLMGRLFTYDGFEKNRERDLWELVIKKNVPSEQIVGAFRTNKIGGEGFEATLSDDDVMGRFEAHRAAKAAKASKKTGGSEKKEKVEKPDEAPPKPPASAPAHVDPSSLSPTKGEPPQKLEEPKGPSEAEARAIKMAEEEIQRLEAAENQIEARRAEEQRVAEEAKQRRLSQERLAAEEKKRKQAEAQQRADAQLAEQVRQEQEQEAQRRKDEEERQRMMAAATLEAAGLTQESSGTHRPSSVGSPTTAGGAGGGSGSALTGKVQAFVALDGTDTHKMLQFQRNTTMEALLDLAEKKYTFPVRLFMMEDGERVELDDEDGLELFLDSCPPGSRGKLVAVKATVQSPITKAPPAAGLPPQRRPSARSETAEDDEQPTPKKDKKGSPNRKGSPPTSRPQPTGGAATAGGNISPPRRASGIPAAPKKPPPRAATQRMRPIIFEQSSPIYCVALSESGKQIVTASRDMTLQVWQTDLSSEAVTLTDGKNSTTSHKTPVLCCEFDPLENEIISGGEDGEIKIWTIKSGKVKHTMRSHKEKVFMVHYSRGAGLHQVSCSVDGTVKVWKNGKCIHTLKEHKEAVYCCNFGYHGDGRYLVSSSGDRSILMWDWHAETAVRCFKGHSDAVWCVRFSHDDKQLVSSATDGEVICWDVSNGVPQYSIKAHLEPIHDVLFSHNDQYIITCSRDWSIKIHEARKGGRKIETLTGHRHAVFHMDLEKDRLVSCSFDNTVRMWALPGMLWERDGEEHEEGSVERNEM